MHDPMRSTAALELARPGPAGRALVRSAEAPSSRDGAVDWAALEPRSAYARFGRPCLRAVLLAAGLPVALVLALPIALVNALHFGGPSGVLFRQRRIGRHGRAFWILKFRTMHGSDEERDDWHPGEDHARVTRFGRFLRNTHLDELPQLVNILRGEMDFIGPRPEMVAIDEWARARIPRFHERYAVRPGLTGLAQVTQGYTPRERKAYRRKLALDRCSLAAFSLALDLEILLRTALWMLRGRGWGGPFPRGQFPRGPGREPA
jgi:lipopolysaccharide/colanic/teichoic acid biosynthesis glycosyltransferase